MYMHDKKRNLLWQTRIITEVYFFVVNEHFIPCENHVNSRICTLSLTINKRKWCFLGAWWSQLRDSSFYIYLEIYDWRDYMDTKCYFGHNLLACSNKRKILNSKWKHFINNCKDLYSFISLLYYDINFMVPPYKWIFYR